MISDQTVRDYAAGDEGDIKAMALELLELRESRRRTIGKLAELTERIDNAIAVSRE
jgi:hypothetical protein